MGLIYWLTTSLPISLDVHLWPRLLKFFVVKYLKKFIGYLILYSPTFLGPSFHFIFGQQNTSHAFPFDLFLVLMLSLIAEKLLEDERKF